MKQKKTLSQWKRPGHKYKGRVSLNKTGVALKKSLRHFRKKIKEFLRKKIVNLSLWGSGNLLRKTFNLFRNLVPAGQGQDFETGRKDKRKERRKVVEWRKEEGMEDGGMEGRKTEYIRTEGGEESRQEGRKYVLISIGLGQCMFSIWLHQTCFLPRPPNLSRTRGGGVHSFFFKQKGISLFPIRFIYVWRPIY